MCDGFKVINHIELEFKLRGPLKSILLFNINEKYPYVLDATCLM